MNIVQRRTKQSTIATLPIHLIFFSLSASSHRLNPTSAPPISPPKWPKKSTPGIMEMINTYTSIDTICFEANYVFPFTFESQKSLARYRPIIPQIDVEAPTAIVETFPSRTLYISLKRLPQIPPKKQANPYTTIETDFSTEVQNNAIETRFIAMCSSPACKNIAEINLKTPPCLTKQGTLAPISTKVFGQIFKGPYELGDGAYMNVKMTSMMNITTQTRKAMTVIFESTMYPLIIAIL